MKRSKSDWLALIEEFEHSGVTIAEFCRERAINPKYFSLRRRQLRSPFVEVKPAAELATPIESVSVKVVSFTVPLSDLSRCLDELV